MFLNSISSKIYNIPNLQKLSPASNPIKFKGLESDTVSLSKNSAEILNEKLLNEYGIQSEIEDVSLLTKFLEVVSEFKELNPDKNLFEGLKIKQENSKGTHYYYDEASKTLIFEEDFLPYIDVNAKIRYNYGYSGSENPKYRLYEGLAIHLLYTSGNSDKKDFQYRNDLHHLSYKLAGDTYVWDYLVHYIATKMSGEILPKCFDEQFKKNAAGLSDLNFPEVKVDNKKSSDFDFKNMKEFQKFLEEYGFVCVNHDTSTGINSILNSSYGAEFNFPLNMAGDFASAVVKMTNALGDKQIFKIVPL